MLPARFCAIVMLITANDFSNRDLVPSRQLEDGNVSAFDVAHEPPDISDASDQTLTCPDKNGLGFDIRFGHIPDVAKSGANDGTIVLREIPRALIVRPQSCSRSCVSPK